MLTAKLKINFMNSMKLLKKNSTLSNIAVKDIDVMKENNLDKRTEAIEQMKEDEQPTEYEKAYDKVEELLNEYSNTIKIKKRNVAKIQRTSQIYE